MGKNHNENLKISFPMWFRSFLTFCEIFMILFFIVYIFRAISNGLSALEIRNAAISLSIVLGGLWFFSKILFYSVTGTDRGLETDNIVGSNKLLLWHEIVEVRRPRFGIPVDFTYVISENKGKLLLVRSMKNYKKLVDLIRLKAPNLQKYQS